MPPSPAKSKTFHKSTGKLFRHRDRGSNSSSSNGNSNGSSNGSSTIGMIRKDETIELKDCPLTLPEVAPLDHTKSLQRYHSLVVGEGLSLEEIDALQLELELLLSSILVRHVAFSNQLETIEQMERGRLPPKMASSPGKRLHLNEGERPLKRLKEMLPKGKEVLPVPSPPRHSKVKCSVVKNEPLFDVPDLTPPENPKPPPAKNDITNKFWSLVDQFCQETTADDIKMLEELLNSQSEDNEYFKIPPLGRHYTLRWAQEDILDEQKETNKFGDGKKKVKCENETEVPDKLLREVDMNGCNDDVAPLGPITQRIISGLVEENVLMAENIENKVQGVGVGRPGFIKNLGLGNAASLEKRIKKELQDQGIIDADNVTEDEDDEILSELKRCQAELKAVSFYNYHQLTRLLRLARESLVRHDLKKKLKDSDAKVIEVYKKLSTMRQKKQTPLKKERESAWKTLKERETLVRQLDLMANNNG